MKYVYERNTTTRRVVVVEEKDEWGRRWGFESWTLMMTPLMNTPSHTGEGQMPSFVSGVIGKIPARAPCVEVIYSLRKPARWGLR